jgi:hypothetical protein
MDIAARGGQTDAVNSDPSGPTLDLAAVRQNVLNIGNRQIQRVLLTAVDTAHNDFDAALGTIEQWFDSSMDRVSGWYKRSSQWIIFWIALFVAVTLNVNAIDIAEFLYRNEAVREAIVARAESAATEGGLATRGYGQARTELESLGLPIGWGDQKELSKRTGDAWWDDVLAPGFGWLLTALAATLGAPFWFDVLNKTMVIRSTVKPREKSPEEASEDRQFPPPAGPAHGRRDAGGPDRHATDANTGKQTRAIHAVPEPSDDESSRDSCDIEFDEATADEDLPPAQGGVC